VRSRGTRNGSQKALEDANIKLTGVVSDVLGKSGRAILDALVAGETDPERLVDLAGGRLKTPRAELVEALRGHVRDHHRFLIRLHLEQIDGTEDGRARSGGARGRAARPLSQERRDPDDDPRASARPRHA
jgi:hypothetical protein